MFSVTRVIQEIYKTMKNDEKIFLIEAIDNINNINKQLNNKKIILSILIFILISLIIILRLIFGEFNYTFLDYGHELNRFYNITINDQPVLLDIEGTKKKQIIPFFFSITTRTTYNINVENYLINVKLGEKIEVKIKSFSCFYNSIPVSCNLNNRENINMILNDDEIYNMKIKKLNKSETIKYAGIYTNDLAPFIDEKGQYDIFVYSRFDESNVSIRFRIAVD